MAKAKKNQSVPFLPGMEFYAVQGGMLIFVPGEAPPGAKPFKSLFKGTTREGFIEIGEWNGRAYEHETGVPLLIGPEGQVWAQINGIVAEES